MPTTDRLYTPTELADLFQVHPETIRSKIRRNEWPHTKLGPRCARFTEAHIEAILALTEQQPQAPRVSRRRRTTN